MNIFDEIIEDHEKQRKQMETLVKTEGDSQERNRVFDDFTKELKAHAAAEEQVFYANLMEDPDGTDKARHSVAEHQVALDLIDELNDASMSSAGWLQKFKQLKHDNEHHMEEEENEVFKKAKEVFQDSEIEKMGKEFRNRKNSEMN